MPVPIVSSENIKYDEVIHTGGRDGHRVAQAFIETIFYRLVYLGILPVSYHKNPRQDNFKGEGRISSFQASNLAQVQRTGLW
jgi:hypothetical protein